MINLAQKKCVACEGGIPSLPQDKVEELLSDVPGWSLISVNGHDQLERELKFKDFKLALAFVNKVGDLAERESHHPNIYVYGWNNVKLELYTHTVNGLHMNDFIVAAKINQLSP